MTANAWSQVGTQGRRELELGWAHEEQREIELTAVEKARRDPVGWLNSGHVWIATKHTDTGKIKPRRLELYPDQVRTIEAWFDLPHLHATGELLLDNLVIEKTRQIGETWAFAGAICWALHYHVVSLGAMHRKAARIDDGGARSTIESLFGRVRYIDRRLDRARVPGLGRLAFRPFSRDPAKIENLDTGSVIHGEGQTDDPFRGSTLDGCLVDEAAFVEHGEKVYAAIDEACPRGKALLSTVNGDGNVHARIADEQPEGWTYLRLHWSTHPVYSKGAHWAAKRDPKTGEVEVPGDAECALCRGVLAGREWSPREPRAHRFPGKLTSPYYDQAVIGKTLEQVANELDIDREGALGGRVYAEFSRDLHVVDAGIPLSLELDVELAADYGLDTTSVIVLQDHPNELRAIGLLEMGDQHATTATPDRVAEALRRYLLELGVPAQFTVPEWTMKLYAIGDPSGHDRETTGHVIAQEYRRAGFAFGRPPRHLTRSVDPSITAVKRLLLGSPKPLRICGKNARGLAAHLAGNVWPTDALGRRRLGATRPEDNVHNHACRALAYYAVTKFPPARETWQVGEEWDDEPVEDPLRRRRRARDEAEFLSYDSSL